MSYGAGSLTISARRAGARTVIERVHYDGLARCSRAFTRGEAALVVLSQLGPGVVRGDELSTVGTVRRDAHLIVTSQTATRLLGGTRPARAASRWTVEDGAVLEIIGEPLVAGSGAIYDATTTIDLGTRSVVLVTEVAQVARDARVRLRTRIELDGREVRYDAVDPAAGAPHAIGSLTIVGIAPGPAETSLLAAIDAAADTLSDVRVGVGAFPDGIFARVAGSAIWPVHVALDVLRTAAWASEASIVSA